MRILTVRQPWAWAIFHGKDVENRSRNIAGDYRGAVAIHAGLELAGLEAALTMDRIVRETRPEFHREHVGMVGADVLVRGTIIGVVDLVGAHRGSPAGCVPDENDRGRLRFCSPWAEPGAWHLVLANPRALDQPIPYRGALGLRETSFEVVGEWLTERAEDCTCGAGRLSYQHEPMCGLEPVAKLVS